MYCVALLTITFLFKLTERQKLVTYDRLLNTAARKENASVDENYQQNHEKALLNIQFFKIVRSIIPFLNSRNINDAKTV